ncbi:MAG TPA: TRAP transporter large permease [Candidatus Methylomirabilis sp.]|nr:TRAP transporter large permease [Candidatus Methylomirabilis sp.]
MLIFFLMMGALLVLMLFGFPVALSMGVTSVLTLGVLRGFTHIPWDMLAQRIMYGVTNFTLLAIPFFILAGRLCNEAKITDRIFEFAKCLVGHFKGGLGHVNVLGSMIFAGMSGSAVADAGGLGQMEIKAMVDEGYSLEFSTAVTAASATIGPIIPPSIPMVIYGAMAGESVAKLLIAGFLPGIIMGAAMMALLVVMAPWYGFQAKPRARLREMWAALKSGVLPLLAPVILIGGIVSGVFTPTEAAAIAVMYATVMGIFYRTLTLRSFLQVLRDSMMDTSIILFIVGASSIYSWVIARYQITDVLVNWMGGIVSTPLMFLFVVNIFLLLVGCFIDPTPALFILVPVFMPMVKQYGIDPIHFGVIMVFNLMIGLVTPPVGTVLYTLNRVTGLSLERISVAMLPWYIPLLVTLVLIVLFPGISLVLPTALLGK